MRLSMACTSVAFALAVLLCMQQVASAQTPGQEKRQAPASGATKLKEILESNVKAEWEAFKNRNKQTYSDLLADDFAAVEDDNEGMRKKSVAVSEVDNSVVNNFHLFALTVIPLSADAALVTYEITLEFPPKAQVRFKRVLVSEVWVKRNSQWKERYYQETHVR